MVGQEEEALSREESREAVVNLKPQASTFSQIAILEVRLKLIEARSSHQISVLKINSLQEKGAVGALYLYRPPLTLPS